jgi:hypothetical protein
MVISLGADQKSPALMGRRQGSTPFTRSDVLGYGWGIVLLTTFNNRNLDEP